MNKLGFMIFAAAALQAMPSLSGTSALVSTAEASSLSQGPSVQRWCGPGGRLCYDPTTTRWTWKKKRRR